jgi:uncharacterized protein (DUF1330 family)
MPAFLIADDEVTDPVVFADYKRLVLPLIERFGGRFLSRGGQTVPLEGGRGWMPDKMVIIEFPDMAALQAWYACPEYETVKEIRLRSARSTLVALESGTV